MIMKKSLLLAAASLAVISCSKRSFGPGEIIDNNNDPMEVKFSTNTANVTPSKVGLDGNGHSTFQLKDTIGIYAVNHGKFLGSTPAITIGTTEGVFPSASAAQYMNKLYGVVSVTGYVPGSPDVPAIAEFKAKTANAIFYQAGGKGWNYYAYYPAGDTVKGTPFDRMNMVANNVAYNVFEQTLSFQDQTKVTGMDVVSPDLNKMYPGPVMFAYYATEDKAPVAGVAKAPTKLEFKYANAKLTMDLEVKGTVGKVGDIASIVLYGTGMTGGFNFDLSKANAKGVSGVYEVMTTFTGSGVQNLDGTNLSNGAQSMFSRAYIFGKHVTKAISHKNDPTYNSSLTGTAGLEDKGKDSTLSVTTGYLVPCQTVTNAKIEVRVADAMGGVQIFTALLDETKGGTMTGNKPGTSVPYKNYLSKIEPGKEYKFKVVVDKKAVNFTGTIEDWVVEDNTSNPIPAE